VKRPRRTVPVAHRSPSRSRTSKARHPDASVARWIGRCIEQFQELTSSPPEAPSDWRRPAKLSCTCSLCRELAKFLANPEEKTHRFPLAKHHRQHLHQIIDEHRCDLTHVTDRRGSPQTLVCNKTNASFKERRKEYELHQKLLKEAKRLQKKAFA